MGQEFLVPTEWEADRHPGGNLDVAADRKVLDSARN